MSVSAPTAIANRPAQMSREEWDARVQLAACYRIFDMLGWTEMIFNHITLRVPGPQRHFLINPYGLWYSEVTATNLVKVDLDGNLVGPSEWPVNRAGFVIHSAIHAAREDAHELGSEEGFVPGEYEAVMWRDHGRLIDQIKELGRFEVEQVRDLGRTRRDQWTQVVFRKPA